MIVDLRALPAVASVSWRADASGWVLDVVTDGEMTITLLLPPGAHETAPTPGKDSPARPPPTRTGATGAASTPSHGPRDLAALDAAQLRRLRYKVAHREGRYRVIPEGLSWEAIVAEGSPWASLVASRGTLRDASGRSNGTPRDGDGTPQRDASGRPFPPSHSPLSPKNPGMEEEGARETGRDGDGTGRQNGTLRDGTGRDAGRPSGTLRDNPLEVLARTSGGRVSHLAAATDQVKLAAALGDLGLTGETLEAFGRALAGNGAAKLWPKSEAAKGRGALTVGFFLGKAGDARMLVDGAQRWLEQRAAAVAPPPPPPLAPTVSVVDSRAAFRAGRDARKGANHG